MLGAIHHPIATLAAGRAFHAPHVRTGPRLGHRQRVHPLAAHGGKEIALDLLALTGHQDILRTAKEMRERHRATAKLTLDKAEFEVIEACAAHRLGEIAGIEAKLFRLAFDLVGDLLRNLAGPFDQILVGIDLVFNETADGFRNHFLFV